MNNAVFWKTMENVREKNRKKNKLFGVKTKLSYYKVFHRKSFNNRNEKSTDSYE